MAREYIIRRASDKEVGIEGGRTVRVHYFFEFSKKQCLCGEYRDLVPLGNDCFRGTRVDAEDADVYEVDDLHKFVEQYGEIVLSAPDNEEGYWVITIYDDRLEI